MIGAKTRKTETISTRQGRTIGTCEHNTRLVSISPRTLLVTSQCSSGSRGYGVWTPPLLAHDLGFLTLDPEMDPPGTPLLRGVLIRWTPPSKILHPPLHWLCPLLTLFPCNVGGGGGTEPLNG